MTKRQRTFKENAIHEYVKRGETRKYRGFGAMLG